MPAISLVKHFKFIAMLLIAVMVLTNFMGRPMPQFARVAPANQAVMVKPLSACQLAKTAQSQTTRSCQSLFGSYAILSGIIPFFLSLTGKLYFLFVLGMLAISHHRRLFKPPKQFICA